MISNGRGVLLIIGVSIALTVGCQQSQEVRVLEPPKAHAASPGDMPADDMEIVREKVRADKKLFVSENLGLTQSEATRFWPAYKSYQEDLRGIGDREFQLIDDYAKNYEAMSYDTARDLLDRYLDIDDDRSKLRRTYLPKFREILPEKKVVRYYQIENKILAIWKFALAAKIPLVE